METIRGGTQISEKHAGFIVNFDHVSGAISWRLFVLLRNGLWRNFGINLEIEPRKL